MKGFTHETIEAIAQMVADDVVAHGVERVITQEILNERCWHYTEVAKMELEKIGPEASSDSSDFCPTATIFGATGIEAPNVRVGFKDGEKRRMMLALSRTCKTMLAQAVIMRIAATTGNMQQIAKAMGLNCPDPHDRQKVDYFEDRMWKWIDQHYGKQRLSALPPEFRSDVILVAGMGPKLKPAGTITEYRWENGKIIFGETRDDGELRMEMIPRWWQ